MKVSVFGLGYVGAVSAACLAKDGHVVVGVDSNPLKVDPINRGEPPVFEPGLADLTRDAVEAGRFRAITDAGIALEESDLALICVGTPSLPSGNIDLTQLIRVAETIGREIARIRRYLVVVVRSTILPGSAGKLIAALEAASGQKAGVDFGFAVYPEFLREGTSLRDYYSPAKIIVGSLDERTRDTVHQILPAVTAPVFHVSIAIAESSKYLDNTWHALKVAFANEMGRYAKAHGLDGDQLMTLFAQDTKLNISAAYLRPGAPFGGSCLPKDVRALQHSSRSLDLDLPVISSILESNRQHLRACLELIMSCHGRRVGLLGLSFKAGTDDLRESPMVDIAEHLLGKGYDVRIYDPNIRLSELVGANRHFLTEHLPHVSKLLVEDPSELISHAETFVLGINEPSFRELVAALPEGADFVDLANSGLQVPNGVQVHGVAAQ